MSLGFTIDPVIVDSILLDATEGRDQAINGDRWYCLSTGARVYTIDISDPENLVLLHTLMDATNLNGAHGITIDPVRSVAWVGAMNADRVTGVDISDDTPVVVGSVQDATNLDLARYVVMHPDGDHVIVTAGAANRITIVNVENPAAPAVVGSVQDATNLVGPEGLAIIGTRVYCGGQGPGASAGLAHVDVSDPANPVVVGFCATASGAAFAIDVEGDYAYTVTSGPSNRLDVYEIANPATHVPHDDPIHVTTLVEPNFERALGVKLLDGMALVPSQSDVGFTAFVDCSDPENPVYMERVEQPTPGGGGSNGSGELYHNYRVAIRDGYFFTTGHGTPAHATSVHLDLVYTVPENTDPPAITGALLVGSTLTCDPGDWTGEPTLTYQWRRGGASIAGATAATYQTVGADIGENVTCLVTATNGAGSDSEASNALVPVAVSLPRIVKLDGVAVMVGN